jgi:hypothetical protein
MEIEEKKLREILDSYQEQTGEKLGTYQAQADQKIDGLKDDVERYLGALKEDFDSKLQVVLEQTSVIPEMQQTLNATFEEVGKMRVDIEAAKSIVSDHEVRLQKLETR